MPNMVYPNSPTIHRLNLLPAVCHSHKLSAFFRGFNPCLHFLWKVRLQLKVSQIHCLIAWEILPPTAVHRKVISWCLELIMAPLLFSNVSTQRVINQSWKFHFNHWARWQTRAELEQEILLFLFRKPFNCSWQSGKRHDVLFSFYNSHFWLRLTGNSWVRSFALSRDLLFHPQ